MLRLTDLREILRYVPRFRDKVFVIAMDGGIVPHENFGNIILDIALLRSLRIRLALVHGAGLQVRQLAASTNTTISNSDGTGITDEATLQLSINAANRVTHEILEGLSGSDLRGACGNAIVAHPAGIISGVDLRYTGRVERIDTQLLQSLLEHDIIPVIPPLGCDGAAQTYRLNSDAVAVEVAKTLKAVKLIYLADHPGVVHGGRLLRQVMADEADTLLKKNRAEINPEAVSKLGQAVRAIRGGVDRVHIIDGRVQEGLLGEVFSNEGIGTLVHAGEYQAIRRARRKDLRAVFGLIQTGMASDELLKRTRAEVERQIEDFFVFEVDGTPVACGAIHFYPEKNKAEVACLYVSDRHENQGIGRKLIQYAETVARQNGATELFCLSTQAINFFVQKGGFRLGNPDDLPEARREIYDRSGRKSQVLIKSLQ